MARDFTFKMAKNSKFISCKQTNLDKFGGDANSTKKPPVSVGVPMKICNLFSILDKNAKNIVQRKMESRRDVLSF